MKHLIASSSVRSLLPLPILLLVALAVGAQNTPPTITGIAPQLIQQDGTSAPIAFTIGDAETPAGLTLGKSSSNPALIPEDNITFGGLGADRTVIIQPVAGQHGTAQIIISVTDPEPLTNNITFLVTVNARPTITTIADQIIGQDTPSQPITFTIDDADRSAFLLDVTAVSTNQAVVPDANLVPGGFGPSREYTITPAPGQTGVTRIIVTVDDGTGGITNTSFLVTVNASPTLTPISDLAVDENSVTPALPVTVADVDTPLSGLVVTASSDNTAIVPNNVANIQVGGSGADRTITVRPAINHARPVRITVSVTDGYSTNRTSFNLTVNALAPTTIDNLARLSNTSGVGDATATLTVTNGVIVARQTGLPDLIALRNVWYRTNAPRTDGYLLTADFLPAAAQPENRGGVMGWLNLAKTNGIALTVNPSPVSGFFEVSVIDFAATSAGNVDTLNGLYDTNGAPAIADFTSARSELGAYDPAVFATFQLEMTPPTAADQALGSVTNTAHLYGRVFQNGSQVGRTIELLTDLPVPPTGEHRVGYFGCWQFIYADGTIGSFDNLSVQEPALSIARGTGTVTVSWPASFLGYRLHGTTNLTTATWAPAAAAGTNSVTLPADEATRFFRLGKP